MKTNASDTPETDRAAYEATTRTVGKYIVPLSVARNLERERDSAKYHLASLLAFVSEDSAQARGRRSRTAGLFAVGDIVCANALIHRSGIHPGGPAGKVINSWLNRETETQIIAVQVGDDKPLCDLLVSDRPPLQRLPAKVKAPSEHEDLEAQPGRLSSSSGASCSEPSNTSVTDK